MPTPIPDWRVPSVVVAYLTKRQVSNQPTTVYQLVTRMGLSFHYIIGLFEKLKVKYVLINHNADNSYHTRTTEIVLAEVPADLALDAQVNAEAIKVSYEKIVAGADVPENIDPLQVDLLDRHRITDRQFAVLKPFLIEKKEVMVAGLAAGYKQWVLKEALGKGQHYAPPSPLWTPYIYRGCSYYSKEILKNLEQCERIYKTEKSLEKARREKKKKLKAMAEGFLSG